MQDNFIHRACISTSKPVVELNVVHEPKSAEINAKVNTDGLTKHRGGESEEEARVYVQCTYLPSVISQILPY